MCKRSRAIDRLPGDPRPYLLYAKYFSKDINAVNRIQTKEAQLEEMITQDSHDKTDSVA
jgi:hypothetical protein